MKYDDPCTAARELQAAYLSLIKGEGAQRVVVKGGGGERDTTFHVGNIAALQLEIREAEEQCDAVTNGTPKPTRYAIRAGQRTRRCL